jgi:beta-glucosidase
MEKSLLISVLMCAAIVLPARSQCIPRDEKVEAQVEALLAKMSLREKVGQMCELAIDKVAQNPMAGNASQTLAGGLLSADAVNNVFGQYKVGSILNVPFGTAQTPEKWSDIIRALNLASLEQCGVPEIYGVDQIHGASYTWGATLFPQEVGQGSSFNPAIPRRIGEITAYETRACLIPWVYSPVMDIARSPLWPRVWESFGEDVLLNGIMASELTRGLQGENLNNL